MLHNNRRHFKLAITNLIYIAPSGAKLKVHTFYATPQHSIPVRYIYIYLRRIMLMYA